jgi:hypothetical protein
VRYPHCILTPPKQGLFVLGNRTYFEMTTDGKPGMVSTGPTLASHFLHPKPLKQDP